MSKKQLDGLVRAADRAVREGTIKTIAMCWFDQDLGFLLPKRVLLDQGWTEKTIRESLGDPDRLGVNPRGGARVLLYSETRVRRAKLRLEGKWDEQDWFDEVNKIMPDAKELGIDEEMFGRMLDDQQFWEQCFFNELSPQQAVDKVSRDIRRSQ